MVYGRYKPKKSPIYNWGAPPCIQTVFFFRHFLILLWFMVDIW